MQAVWANYAPQTVLRGPSAEASKQLVARPMEGARSGFTEYYRAENGRILEFARLDSRYSSFSGLEGDNSGRDTPFFSLFNFFDRGIDPGGPFGPSGGPRARVRPRNNVPNIGSPRTNPPPVDFFGLFR